MQRKAARKARTKYLNIRLSEREHEFLSERAELAGYSISQFVRLSVAFVPIRNRADERSRVVALNRINSNLNQLARWANKYRSAAEAASVVTELVRIERAVNRLAGRKRGASNDE